MSRNHAPNSEKTCCLLSSRSHVRIVPGASDTYLHKGVFQR
jgi:hypothetical protein